MTRSQRICGTLLTVAFAGGIAVAASTDVEHGSARNPDEMKFAPLRSMPACSESSLQSGNPATGPSIALAKLTTGCEVPWHWHTPNEHLMMVSGEARIDTKDERSVALRAGGFARMPSRHVHRFTCVSECLLYVASDAAFDVHYVDAEDREIPPETAFGPGGRRSAEAAP